jgi:hypothetical protein
MNIRARFNPEDVTRLSRGFAIAVQAEAERTLEHLSNAAIRQLGDFDEALGHHYLASLWTHTAAVEAADGTYMEVYSLAEDMTFYDKSSTGATGRTRSSKYPIAGEQLLQILEGGARPHPIAPRDPRGVLALPLPGSESRTREFVQRHGPGSFLPSEVADFRDFVANHPGVEPNQNIARTRTMIELGLETYAEAAASSIALNLVD